MLKKREDHFQTSQNNGVKVKYRFECIAAKHVSTLGGQSATSSSDTVLFRSIRLSHVTGLVVLAEIGC